MKKYRWIIIVGAIIFILSIWKGKAGMSLISGIVDTSPEQLAKADGVPVEVESLARAMQSEESTEKARVAIGWAIKNMAHKQGLSITKLVTKAKDPKVNGKYSRQDVGPSKYCASFVSPSSDTLRLAAAIFSGATPDPTGGATQWDAPKAQAQLHARNPAKYKSPEDIATTRAAAGRTLVIVDGVPNTRFWA